MGAFDLLLGGELVRVPNHFAYRAHDRVLKKACDLNGSLVASLKIGVAGPDLQSFGDRPNYFGDHFTLSKRMKLSDFTASDFSNDGGLIADDVRSLMGYARSSTGATITRDHIGAVLRTDWLELTSRMGWQPYGSFGTDWQYENNFGPEKIQRYPYTTPKVKTAWWTGGNPWSVDCPTCDVVGIWGVSVPAGLVYVTITTNEDTEEIFAAALFNGADWWRVGGGINARYGLRLGPGRCSGDYAFELATRLFAGGRSRWNVFKYVALAVDAAAITIANTIVLTDAMLAFADKLDVAWTITGYTPDTWTVSDPDTDPPDIPEVLPSASLDITTAWSNSSGADVTVKAIGVVGYNVTDARWELLFWGPLDTPAVVHDGDSWQPSSFVLKLLDLEGV